MKIKRAILINAPLKKAYSIAENYPLFVKSFQKKEILFCSEKASKVRITNVFFFIPLTWEGESRKIKNERMEWRQTSGLLEGLKADWIFCQKNNDQTEVIIEGEYSGQGLRGIALSIIGPMLILKALSRILNSLKVAAEC